MEKIDIEIVGSDNCSFSMHFSIFLYIKCLKNWKESFALPWAMARARILDMKSLICCDAQHICPIVFCRFKIFVLTVLRKGIHYR